MPNFFDTAIFNSLTPDNFNRLSEHFLLGLSVPADARKVEGEAMSAHLHAMRNYDKEVLVAKVRREDGTEGMVTRQVGAFQDFLQRLHNLVTSKCDIIQLVQDLRENRELKFEPPPEFDGWTPYNKGAYVFLADKEFWESLYNLSTARDCESKRL